MLPDENPNENADDEAIEAAAPAEQPDAAKPDTESDDDDVEGFGSSWS